MQAGESLEGSFQVIKLLSRRPSQWEQCIAVARLKFEKYFKRKVMSLLLKIHIHYIDCICVLVKIHNVICSVYMLLMFFCVGPTTVALFPPGHKVKRWK